MGTFQSFILALTEFQLYWESSIIHAPSSRASCIDKSYLHGQEVHSSALRRVVALTGAYRGNEYPAQPGIQAHPAKRSRSAELSSRVDQHSSLARWISPSESISRLGQRSIQVDQPSVLEPVDQPSGLDQRISRVSYPSGVAKLSIPAQL